MLDDATHLASLTACNILHDFYSITISNDVRKVYFRLLFRTEYEGRNKSFIKVVFPIQNYKLKKLSDIDYTLERADGYSLFLLHTPYKILEYEVFKGYIENLEDKVENVKFRCLIPQDNFNRVDGLYAWEVPEKEAVIRLKVEYKGEVFNIYYAFPGVFYRDCNVITQDVKEKIELIPNGDIDKVEE